ncbi:MAG: threonine aldolase [Promethearchaeia archaeon]|nr:MAG: threonine aldolase [Candidatus Lokiarchaeia archaeon]
MPQIFDFRSDTVTKPSSEMWEAIKSLKNDDLGDDVEREDPTVNKLEEKCAKLVGKEAALFVTSGTQGNLTSLLTHTHPGEEILIEEYAHIYKYEVGGAARLGGLVMRTYPSQKGIFDPFNLQPLIHYAEDIHEIPTTMICLENTHNYHGGVILPVDLFQNIRKFADSNNLKVHLDGARIFNAAVAKGIPASEFTQYVDSVQFCLSKGLSCPVGSIIAGSEEFITKARKIRKMLGGGWRQAGILAAMGLVAIEDNWIHRLQEDHQNAQLLARGIQDAFPDFHIEMPETNIVMLPVPENINAYELSQQLQKEGIYQFDMGPRIRFVTHYGITADDIENSILVIEKVILNALK